MSSEVFELVRQDLARATQELRRSLDWYAYTVETVIERTRLPIDGDFRTRRWWFVLREVA